MVTTMGGSSVEFAYGAGIPNDIEGPDLMELIVSEVRGSRTTTFGIVYPNGG